MYLILGPGGWLVPTALLVCLTVTEVGVPVGFRCACRLCPVFPWGLWRPPVAEALCAQQAAV